LRLLLVEDDPALGPQLQAAFQQAGYAVDLATDGVEAEAVGMIEPYDLVVLDLGLPRCPGLAVLEHWRSNGHKVPVVILTARDSWQEKVEGFKAGADDYVAKPFQFEELLARVSAVLKRSQGGVAGRLQVNSLTLDEDRQVVLLPDGREYPLTGTEFRLLRYFMLHPGQVLSKTRLTDHVYEYDADKDSNVIEVYINRLRQKIGLEMIRTRRGQGYVFAETGS
jgi:two-component system OmpR family response regulator